MPPCLQKDALVFPPLYQLLNNLYKYNFREPFYIRPSSQTDHQEKYALQFGGKGCSLTQVSYWTDRRRFFCHQESLLVHQINKSVLKRTGQKIIKLAENMQLASQQKPSQQLTESRKKKKKDSICLNLKIINNESHPYLRLQPEYQIQQSRLITINVALHCTKHTLSKQLKTFTFLNLN